MLSTDRHRQDMGPSAPRACPGPRDGHRPRICSPTNSNMGRFPAGGGLVPMTWALCNQCDFAGCVHPAHMRLGTNATNRNDLRRRNLASPLADVRGDADRTRAIAAVIHTRHDSGETLIKSRNASAPRKPRDFPSPSGNSSTFADAQFCQSDAPPREYNTTEIRSLCRFSGRPDCRARPAAPPTCSPINSNTDHSPARLVGCRCATSATMPAAPTLITNAGARTAATVANTTYRAAS